MMSIRYVRKVTNLLILLVLIVPVACGRYNHSSVKVKDSDGKPIRRNKCKISMKYEDRENTLLLDSHIDYKKNCKEELRKVVVDHCKQHRGDITYYNGKTAKFEVYWEYKAKQQKTMSGVCKVDSYSLLGDLRVVQFDRVYTSQPGLFEVQEVPQGFVKKRVGNFRLKSEYDSGSETVVLDFVDPSRTQGKADVLTDVGNTNSGVLAIEFEGVEDKIANISNVTILFNDDSSLIVEQLTGKYQLGTKRYYQFEGNARNIKEIRVTGTTNKSLTMSGRIRIDVFAVVPK